MGRYLQIHYQSQSRAFPGCSEGMRLEEMLIEPDLLDVIYHLSLQSPVGGRCAMELCLGGVKLI